MNTFAITPSGLMFVLGILVWTPSGYHLYENLAKFSFKSKIKYTSLITFIYIFFKKKLLWCGKGGNHPTRDLAQVVMTPLKILI